MGKTRTSTEKELGVHFNLEPIFRPKSMVVVGISTKNYINPGTTTFLKNVFETNLGEKCYAVNPRGGEIEGQKIYREIKNLPEIPDIAVIAVQPNIAVFAIEECIFLGVKGLILISGGFAETGTKEGRKIQNQIAKMCLENNVPLIGPNCVGVFNPPYIDSIFLQSEKLVFPPKGNVSIVSQSGGILLDQFFLAFKSREIGVSSAVSVGNKAVINEVHMLEYYAEDKETDVISFYLEGFGPGEGRQFLESSKKTKKDIVIYSGGTTEASKSAIQSHTASIATNFEVARSAFKQYGILQPITEMEVLNYIKTYSVLASSKKPIRLDKRLSGKVAILSVSGGHGVVCSDLLHKYDLELVQFTEHEQEEMRARVTSTVADIGGFSNPIDITGAGTDADIIGVLDYLMQLEKVEIVLCIVVPYPPQISVQIGRRIAITARKYPTKPLVCFVPYIEKYDLIRESLELFHIPLSATVSETVQLAAAIRDKSRALLRLKKHK
ncbi:MAG: CoA-binding protein [Candidatus Lokiarchaeota archaeon]|nr:CoA-binding protein [Candidatus Lokiarchaeota archaeon]